MRPAASDSRGPTKVRFLIALLTVGASVLVTTGERLPDATGRREGFKNEAYPDPATKGAPWTVGFGETHGVKKGDRTTRIEALKTLSASLEAHATGVRGCVTAPVSQGEFNALVDMAYHYGVGTVCGSSVVKRFNAGDYWGGCMAILLYYRARVNGVLQPMPGLVKRSWENYNECVA